MKTKTLIAVVLLVMTGSVGKAQTLKEALYGGKLRSDTGSVVRKGDSLKMREAPVKKEEKDSITKVTLLTDSTKTETAVTTPATDTTSNAAVAANPAKDNNKIWKDFMDEFTGIIRTEVLTSKKIKDGTYSVLIEYEIGLDGAVAINNVSSDPKSEFLENQIKERLTYSAPQLNPVLLSNGKPRKVLKKQMLTLAK